MLTRHLVLSEYEGRCIVAQVNRVAEYFKIMSQSIDICPSV